jgi:hypothetical protein
MSQQESNFSAVAHASIHCQDQNPRPMNDQAPIIPALRNGGKFPQLHRVLDRGRQTTSSPPWRIPDD